MYCPRSSSGCSGMQGIYAQLEGDIGICALFYIYRSAKSCAKFGVVVFKASMLDWRGDIDHRYICIVLYIYRSAIRFDRFGVVVLKASMLDLQGGH